MSKKKLAIVISGDFPEGNTKNARLKIISKGLASHDWETTFLSAYPTRFSLTINYPQPKKWEGMSIQYFSISRKYWAPKFFRIFQIAFSHLSILFWTLFRAHKYDAFYYYNPRFTDTLLSMMLQRVLGRKVVVDQTELFSSQKNKSYHEIEERIIAKYPSALFVISKPLIKHYEKLRKEHLYKYPIIIDTSRFDREHKEQKHLLGYIGSFAAKDGVDLLIHAVSKLIVDMPKLRLRLVGYNNRMNELNEMCKELGIADHVELTGTVSYHDIPWLLLECDTLLMNRNDSDFATYGYPIKLGEYFACKKPVIMSNGPGFSEDFEHRNEVYKYEVNSVESLVDTIKYRYKNIGESDAVAYRGYQYAKDHFDGDKMVLFLTNILNQI